VVAISEATRRDVIRLLGVEPHRVVTIPCGADARFRPHLDPTELRAFRDANDLPEHFMLYLGTIEPRKNLIRLMDAYAEVQRRVREPWPLILAGGAGWGVEEIRAHADRLRLGPRLRFAGYVEEAEIPLWYNAADLFVYPSEYEGFGLPALEALACGTPVVTSDRSSLPEVVGECAILVNPSDPTSIADGIVRAIDDAELRHRLSQGGPERAKRFSWERMAEETLAVYRSVSAA
jgi:glycosyltransferase involved in cell wall biosynthesis